MKRVLTWVGALLLALLIGIQFLSPARTNPPVTREIKWDTPATRKLAQRACFDCHSNMTTWPWYSHVAPVSLLVVNDTDDGRRALNFSEWDKPQRADFDDVDDKVSGGEMQLQKYLILHHDAKLTAVETKQLLDGLQATFKADPPIPRKR